MEEFQWRGKAEVVGYTHLIFSTLAVYLLVITMLVGTNVTLEFVQYGEVEEHFRKYYSLPPADEMDRFLWISWLISFFFLLFSFLQLYSSLKLLHATDFWVFPEEAFRMLKFWRNCTILFVIIDVTVNAALLYYKMYDFTYILSFICPAYMIYHVIKYYVEVEGAVKGNTKIVSRMPML